MSPSRDRSTEELPAGALAGVVGRVMTLPSCRLACTAGPDQGRDWIVDQPIVRIGRSADAEVPLADGAVSRIHAVLKLTAQGWTVTDAGSRHGIRLDGVRVETAYVSEGSRIHLGATELTFSPSQAEIATTVSATPHLHGVIGGAPAMRELFGAVHKLAPLKVSAIITGPTGSGKGALARALHAASPRAAQPFVVLDCANLDPALMRARIADELGIALTTLRRKLRQYGLD